MKSFAEMRQMAEARKGAAVIAQSIADVADPDMSGLTDDRILAEFTKRIFQAGFNWQVIENKWPEFEAAFHGFDIGRNAMMSDADLDVHLQNTDIVRNPQKILTIRDNAIFLSDLAREHGSAAGFLADWPQSDTVGLFDLLKKRGSRLGGVTGQYALRFMGYGNFILSRSVVTALNVAGVIDGAATSKSAQKKVQAAFNGWAAESGLNHAAISRVLAQSVDD
ncbi:DNA-3-methyladenine glycosylase I [Actibacterium ureilyticum]|uniref:DNA-3-methyladenine glycosylase I n=1 Tax=Actibacterium ureilyticum TaxID=1590614 RepID=UPI000BAAC42F|nr:DNA-3-methyladenine glycosylase I [Actibacterium ureilyticum]